jgi:hypothetical protein
MRSSSKVMLALCLGLLALSCDDDDGTKSNPTSSSGSGSVTKSVGPEGGTIEVGGAVVTFPPNALTAPVTVTISATDEAAPKGFVALSKIFKCGPSGTSFAEPVTMNMPFTADGKPATMFWSTNDSPEFKDVGGTPNAGMMSATVRHFSSGFVGHPE